MAEPASGGVKVEGLAGLIRALKLAEQVETLTALRDANLQAAETVWLEAGRRIPIVSGRLVRTLTGSATAARGTVKVGSKAKPYAGPVHFGWPAKHIKPQPFLYDALDARRAEVLDAYQTRFEKICRALDQPHTP